MVKDYASHVFINCPFDDEYQPILDAIIFAVFDCGFIPKCALEEDNSGSVRFDKIKRLISDSKYGIHDISRTELDEANSLPRFNMPLELGVFIWAERFGSGAQKNKNMLILDREKYRYQKFISDIAGQDIRAHEQQPRKAVSRVRDWLNSSSGRKTIPGGAAIWRHYERFRRDLPAICDQLDLMPDEVTYNDFCNIASDWLQEQD